MKTTEFSFLSLDGKTTVHAVRWEPDDGQYRAILQITHGMVEYIERYAPFAEYLTGQGFLVVGHDHIGHGHSVADTEQLGYFAEKDPSGILVGDIHQLRHKIQQENPGLPYFILGHSMGSFMLRKYLSFYGKGLAGAIIMGTGFVDAGKTGAGLILVRMLSRLEGSDSRSKVAQQLLYGPAYQGFDLTGENTADSWLSRDTEMVKKYYADPGCTFAFTLNGYEGLLDAVRYSCKEENAEKIPKDLPILLASGGNDPVGDLEKGVRKVQQLYQKVGIQDLDCIIYEGARHEILNEVNRQQVFADLYTWLDAHAK